MDWRQDLSAIINSKAKATRAEQENAMFEAFLAATATPALRQLGAELEKLGREVVIREAPASTILTVRNAGAEEITFRVMKHFVPAGILPCADIRLSRNQRLTRYENVMFRPDPQAYPISAVTLDDVIQCFLKYYRMVLGD